MKHWKIDARVYRFGGRTGWVLRASASGGQRHYSEVVLSERRATESQAAAQAYLKKLQEHAWTAQNWPQAPSSLPACRAGLELLKPPETQKPQKHYDIECSHLVSMDLSPEATLQALQARHAKVKIGEGSLQAEQDWVRSLAYGLQERGGVLKLDANGRLSFQETQKWLRFLETLPNIAYLEQPLPPGEETTLEKLCKDTSTPLALDESLCAPQGLARALEAQWPGVLALKPMLLGIEALPLEDENVMQRVVLSCAWETVFGLTAWIEKARTLPLCYPIGLMTPCFTPKGQSVPAPSRIVVGEFFFNNM